MRRRLLLLAVTALVLTGTGATEALAVDPPTSGIAATPGQGYWQVARDGGVFSRGDAGFFGSKGGQPLNAPIVGMAVAPGGQGYWLVGADGGVFAFGSAGFFGSMAGQPLNAPVTGIAAAPNGQGYWLVAGDGGVFAFGPGAAFFGSAGGQALNAPITGIAAAPDGRGYWLVGADGGLFTFGPGAGFFGSGAGQTGRAPVVGIAAAPNGQGYWLAGADGGVFAFGPGAPFHGSAADGPIVSRIGGIARTPDGGGYWLADVSGGVYAFGNAPELQPRPARPLPPPPPRPAPPPQPKSAPPQSLGGECETKPKVRGRELWSACLRRTDRGYRSEVAVRVAGIDITPARGKDIRVGADGRVTSDDARMSLSGTGPLLPSILPNGVLVLQEGGRVDFTLGAPKHLDLAGIGSVLRKVGGLPLVDAAGLEMEWTNEGARLKVAVSLGGDFVTLLPPVGIDPAEGSQTLKRGFGAEVSLTTRNETGLSVDKVKATVAAGRLYGALALQELSIEYDATNKVWSGGATIVPFGGPLAKYGLPTVKGEIGITIDPLGFGRLALEIADINKPMGSFVFLQKLGGEIIRVPPPFTIKGEGAISLGPEIDVPLLGKFRAAEAEGSLEWSYPATVKTKASIKILGQRTASGEINADAAAARGDLAADLSLAIRKNGFVGHLEGWVHEGSFLLKGDASVRIAGHSFGGGEAFVSNRGLGGCRDGLGPDFGFTLDFSKSGLGALEAMGWGCDFNGLDRKLRLRQAGGGQRFAVSRNSLGMLVRVRAAGGPPSVILRGRGQEFALPAGIGLVELPQLTALRDDETGELWIVLNPPADGAWTIDPLPGGLPLLAAETAEALPPPNLRGRLRRLSRGRLELRWSTNAVRGQRVGFVERGPNGLVRPLLRTTRARGTLRFRPSPGAAGTRTIVGAVELGGSLRDLRNVASIGTGLVRPPRPGVVRLRRSGSSVAVTWRGVRGAGGYIVSVRLRDGRRFERFVGERQRRTVLTGVRRATRGRVAVRAFTPSAILSRAATSTFGRR